MEILSEARLTLLCRISRRWVQATSAINSVAKLQNLLGTTLVLSVVFKTKLPPLKRLLCIQPKSQTSTLTLSLHRCRPRRQLCAPSINGRRLWRRLRLSAQGRRSGSSHQSLQCTRRLAAAFRPWAGECGAPAQSKPIQGDCAYAAEARQKGGSANTSNTRDIKKQWSLPCFRDTFHCPTWLTITLPKKRLSTFGMFRSMSGREDCSAYYTKPWTILRIPSSGTWIHKNSIHKWIHYRNLSYDFMNSYMQIHIAYFNTVFFFIFSNEFISWIHIYKFVYVNSKYI